MNRAQTQLRTWAYGMADQTIARIKSLGDADSRARALRAALEDMRPGLDKLVRQRTVVFRRLGHSYPSALREALAEQYMKIAAHRVNESEALGNGDEPSPSRPDAAREPTREERIMDSVGSLISGAITGALGIAERVQEVRQERREFQLDREQWRREQAQAETQAEREYQLAQQRLATEQRTGELEALEAEREAALEERLRALTPAGSSGLDVGTFLIVGGLLVVVGVGGYLIYKSVTKKHAEREER